MTQQYPGEVAAHGQALAVLEVTTSNTRHAASDPVLDHVVAELEDRRRAVHVWRAEVPDRAPGSWLPALAQNIHANLLSTSDGEAPSSVHAFGWRAVLGLAAGSSAEAPALVAHLGDGPGGTGRDDLASRKLERLLWAAARTVDAVVLDSEWAINRAAACGVPRARLVRGLPVVTSPDADVPWSIRDGARSPRLVAVGGVGPTAGTDTLLDAVARIQGVELVVAAPSDVAESRLVKARRWLRRRNGAGDRVRLERFSRSLLEDCDAVVDAGTGAGCADGVVRAMAHRRAVIASDVGPRAEAVVAGTTGELVAPGDPRRWRDRICQLLQDPFRLEAYGDAGYERSRVGFAPARRAELILHLDERLAEARPVPVNRALDAA
ncbi:MAG TPA: glycosyltransferase family 4 protein [Actinomycetales bacterium]|nr:glycosyltransferase family 4 protein [Actinomycetales bacterium]